MATIHAEVVGQDTLAVLAGGFDAQEDVALAAKRLKALTPLFKPSDPPGALVTPLTWPTVVQLSATYGESFVPGPRLCGWITEETLTRTTLQELSYTAPAGLTPYPWQVSGAQMIAATGHALITDEPGTGKTAAAILGLVEWCGRRMPDDNFPSGPVVVVCPASVVDHWVESWRTWAPDMRTVAWRGTPKHRRSLPGTADVYVTSYDTARMDAPTVGTKEMRALLELRPAALVIDEHHFCKNAQAERTKSVRRLAKTARAVVALSGTPITHHPGDLWPTLDCLAPGAWPSRERWVNRYCETVPGDYKDEILGLLPAHEPEFRVTLLGQHRRVAKADVLADLPPKVYSVRTVELPTKWRKVYDDMESQMLAELPDGEELSVMSVLAQMTRLSQLACAAADVHVTEELNEQTGELVPHTKVTLKAPSWKVDALIEVLDERPDAAVGVFAPSRQLTMLAGAAAEAAGRRVGYVVGGQSMAQRTETVANFQSGNLDLICATTGAGGVGLTLTAAGTCVFLQRPWSLVESLQAEDRFHRIGSERHSSIEIVDIVARNTIDSRVRAVLRERAGQLADLVQDPRLVAELLGGTNVKRQSDERKAS